MAHTRPPSGPRAGRPRIECTVLSDCSWSVPPEQVPTAVAQHEADGWQRIPTYGRREYARLCDDGVTMIFYHSGLIIFTGPAGGEK